MSPSNLSRAGLIGVVGGLIGTATAVGILFWPEHSADDLFRYPFTPSEFFLFQGVFFLQHLGLVVLLVALAFSGAARGRIFQTGAWVAALGMGLFCVAEVLAMGYVDADLAAANAGAIGATYGVASVVNGLGMLVAGAGTARAHRWSGWRRWSPLATGVSLFVVVVPGLFGGFVVGRVVIAVWMLLFAAVGWSLYVESRGAAGGAGQGRIARPVGATVS